jgi:hypothetical protein
VKIAHRDQGANAPLCNPFTPAVRATSRRYKMCTRRSGGKIELSKIVYFRCAECVLRARVVRAIT